MKEAITQRRLKEVLHYDPETGVFTRLESKRVPAFIGKPAGTLSGRGDICIFVDGKLHKAHRLAWLYMTGEWPTKNIDHIDVDSTNNKWNNLRLSTQSQNGANQRKFCKSSSEFKGVTWDKSRRKWRAQIKVNRKLVYLGRYNSEIDAQSAYESAALEHFGEFKRAAVREEKIPRQSLPKKERSTTGYRGVSQITGSNPPRWRAFTRISGKFKYLGVFSAPEDAYVVAKAAEENNSGERKCG